MEYQVYRDAKYEWRWKLISSNGETVADSGEGYKNKTDCLHGIYLVKGSVNVPVVEK